MIPVFKPAYGPEELEALRKPFETGWIGLGPLTAQFEKEFAQYNGSPHMVAVNSCTSALYLAFHVLGIEGGEVITTPMTFISTNHAILHNRGLPVFCDIEPDTLNIDAAKLEALITPKTKAIVVVHYGGHACDMDAILAIAERHRLPVVEDAAHASGGLFRGKKLGSLTQLGCFSFHAVKNLATGEGGMISVKDSELDARLRRLRWMGISKDTWKRSETGARYSWFYTVEEIGFKCHMSDIQSALGLVQLKKLDRLNDRRREIAQRYSTAFKSLPWLEVPIEKPYASRSWHNYVVRIGHGKRDAFMSFLEARDIATSVHYFPNHLYDIYKPFYRELPVAEMVWKEIVTLPLFPDLTDAQVTYIIDSVRAFPG